MFRCRTLHCWRWRYKSELEIRSRHMGPWSGEGQAKVRQTFDCSINNRRLTLPPKQRNILFTDSASSSSSYLCALLPIQVQRINYVSISSINILVKCEMYQVHRCHRSGRNQFDEIDLVAAGAIFCLLSLKWQNELCRQRHFSLISVKLLLTPIHSNPITFGIPN